MRIKNHLRPIYFSSTRNSFFVVILLIIFCLSILTILPSCKKKLPEGSETASEASSITSEESELSDDNTVKTSAASSETELIEDTTGKASMPFSKAISWGPIKIFKGYVEKLYIKNSIGIGSVIYNAGETNEGTYIYVVNVSNGKVIGNVEISGQCYAVDICERYAFVWVKDGINIYDLEDKFKLVQTIASKPDEWISNFGNFLFVEGSEGYNAEQASDYLIDKRSLQQVNLNIPQDEDIYALLYPDCLIGSPTAFNINKSGFAAVYSLKDNTVLGYLPDQYISNIFAWDPDRNLFFCHDRDKIKVYDLSAENFISELPLSVNEVNAIVANTQKNLPYTVGSGNRLRVIRDFYLSENGFYFFNGEDSSYILNSSGQVECQLKNSSIIGDFKDYTFFKKEDSIGINQYDCSSLWTKERPTEPSYGEGPNFTKDSIAWLCSYSGLKGHGDVIYQWNYDTGSFLNYTEFTGYEVKILSSDPLIIAIRSIEGGSNAAWSLICYKPSKLPFNIKPDIEIEYSPEKIFAESTEVKFKCLLKDLPPEVLSQNIIYEWNFGDGTTGSGQEVTHTYLIKGDYNVSVDVKLGQSGDTGKNSVQIAVLEPSEIELIATPIRYTVEGLEYCLECITANTSEFWVEWDFGDGKKETGFKLFHAFEPGDNYTVTATVYNWDDTQYGQKTLTLEAKFPEYYVSVSPLKGDAPLSVDFNCNSLNLDLPETVLIFKWIIDNDIFKKKNFNQVLICSGIHKITLDIRDPNDRLVLRDYFWINVKKPALILSDGGRKITNLCSMFVTNLNDDPDGDYIDQAWEDEAMRLVNPLFILDEGEDWCEKRYSEKHKVVNFVRITPYPDKYNRKYIIFYYCIAWSRDYGRYLDKREPFFNIFRCHNGDTELVIMAWKVIDSKHLELKYVYTSAHGDLETGHSAVWNAKGETVNFGHYIIITHILQHALYPIECDDDQMIATLEFNDNRLTLYASEDKHAIYPTKIVGENVKLVVLGLVPFGEDCGGGSIEEFYCYNVGEPDTPLMDDIGDIFPNERIWSGNIDDPELFAGGLEVSDDCPYKIGVALSDLDSGDLLWEALNPP